MRGKVSAPRHWSEKYIGREWIQQAYDCASLFLEVQEREFNRTFHIPVDRTDMDFYEMSDELGEYKLSLADKTTTPIEGDAVLMSNKHALNHIGIYCLIRGIPHILHNQKGRGVWMCKLRDLDKYTLGTLSVEGFYRLKASTEANDRTIDPNISPQQTSATTIS